MLGLAHSHFTFTLLFGRNTLKAHPLDPMTLAVPQFLALFPGQPHGIRLPPF
jgi:hypothetical protein